MQVNVSVGLIPKFADAVELEPARRVDGIHYLVHQLPDANFHMLDILCAHLNKSVTFHF